MRNYTTVSLSKKHDRMLDKQAEKNKRDKKSQLEFLIEREELL